MDTQKKDNVSTEITPAAPVSADATSTIKAEADAAAIKAGKEKEVITLNAQDLETIREQVRKETRDKFIAQVSKKDAEVKALRAQLKEKIEGKNFDQETLDMVEEISKIAIQEKELENEVKSEEEKFFTTHADLTDDERTKISALKETFSNMSWDTARKLYLSETDPSRLIANGAATAEQEVQKKKTLLPIGGAAPIAASPAGGSGKEAEKSEVPATEEQLDIARNNALKEFARLIAR